MEDGNLLSGKTFLHGPGKKEAVGKKERKMVETRSLGRERE